MKDRLFKKEIPPSYKFKFDESVAAVFDDMLVRSIPFYEEVKRMVGELTKTYYQPQTSIYDLGCSTGIGLYALTRYIESASVKLIGVDSSEAMITKAQERLAQLPESYQVELRCEDILETPIANASVVLMDYTLQFIQPDRRPIFLKRLFEGILPNGILLISEKVKASSPFEEQQVEYYEDFKKRNGYTELEIAQKRKALENVLIANTLEQNNILLKQAGFSTVEVIFKWYNFVTLLAIR